MIFHKVIFFIFFISFHSLSAEILKIVRGNENYPPYEMVVNDTLTGFHIELIKETAQRCGFEVSFCNYPWKRALQSIKEKKVDCISYVAYTEERAKYILFEAENVLSASQFGFVALKENEQKLHYDGTLSSISKNTILCIRGYKYCNSFEQVKALKKYYANDLTTLIKMLEANRYLIAIVNLDDFQNRIAGTEFASKVKVLQPTFCQIPVYIGFANNTERSKTAKLFAAELEKFKKTNSYVQLKKKYGIFTDD